MWDIGRNDLCSISEYVVNKQWKLIENPKGIEEPIEFRILKVVRVRDAYDGYVLGYWELGRFKIISQFVLQKENFFISKTIDEEVWIIKEFSLLKGYEKKDFHKKILDHFLNDKRLKIMSNNKFYLGAPLFWSDIIKYSDFIVDIVDISNNELIKMNVSLDSYYNYS